MATICTTNAIQIDFVDVANNLYRRKGFQSTSSTSEAIRECIHFAKSAKSMPTPLLGQTARLRQREVKFGGRCQLEEAQRSPRHLPHKPIAVQPYFGFRVPPPTGLHGLGATVFGTEPWSCAELGSHEFRTVQNSAEPRNKPLRHCIPFWVACACTQNHVRIRNIRRTLQLLHRRGSVQPLCQVLQMLRATLPRHREVLEVRVPRQVTGTAIGQLVQFEPIRCELAQLAIVLRNWSSVEPGRDAVTQRLMDPEVALVSRWLSRLTLGYHHGRDVQRALTCAKPA